MAQGSRAVFTHLKLEENVLFEHSICSIFFGQMRRTTFQILGECALALLRDWDITVARTFLQNAGFSHTPSFFILLLRLLQFLRNCPRIWEFVLSPSSTTRFHKKQNEVFDKTWKLLSCVFLA